MSAAAVAKKRTPPKRVKERCGSYDLESQGRSDSHQAPGCRALPHGWSWKTISDLVSDDGVFIDGDWVESKDQDPTGDVRLIQLADVGDGVYRDRSNRFMTKAKADALYCTFLQQGDVLIARMPDPLGRACVFPGDSKPSVTVVDVAIVRSGNGEFDHRWLMHFVNAHSFRSAISSLQAGSTRKRISRGNLATIPLPVPPLLEQRRIVAEIEKQFTRLDAGVAALRRVQANLKRYRAAVLKAACEGRLIPDRRNWTDGSLGDVLKTIEAGKSFKCDEHPPSEEQVGVVKVSAVTWGTYDETETKTCTTSERVDPRYFVQESDFLFSRANTIELIGACVIAKKVTLRVMLSDKILRFRFSDGVDPRWVLYWLRSEFGRREIERLATGNQESMRNIGQERIKRIRMKFPPLADQSRIVAEVDRRLSLVEELEAISTVNLQRATRLRQSILQRAFAGQRPGGRNLC